MRIYLAAIVKMMGPLGYAVTIGEFFGGLGLIFGFLSRFSAASLIVIMLGAIGMVHGQYGFFLGRAPTDTLATSGFEYNLALIGLLAPVLIGLQPVLILKKCLQRIKRRLNVTQRPRINQHPTTS